MKNLDNFLVWLGLITESEAVARQRLREYKRKIRQVLKVDTTPLSVLDSDKEAN